MKEPQTLWLLKLAQSVGRLDFWNIPDELTAYELSVLQAAYEIDPWGNERDDLRAAWNTVLYAMSQAAKKPDESAIQQMLQNLMDFTEVRQKQTESRVDGFDKVQAMFGG